MTDEGGRGKRLWERVTDPEFSEDLAAKTVEELRALKAESGEAEKELSFERRLCQARIDILTAEVARRSGDDKGDLLARLPAILATEGRSGDSPLPDRAPDWSMPRNADIPRRRVEEIVGEQTLARLSTIPTEEIGGIVESLAAHEKIVSERRRKVQGVVDAIQAAVVRRYQEDPNTALATAEDRER